MKQEDISGFDAQTVIVDNKENINHQITPDKRR